MQRIVASVSLCAAVSLAIAMVHAQSAAPTPVRLATEDGGLIHGDLYGTGPRGVVLAHGGRFNKGSWAAQARELAEAGFRVLAIDFRGYGDSAGPGTDDVFTAPLYLDVLAGVRHLRATGATTVAAMGGSLGGSAAADAVIAEPGAIDRLILLGSTPDGDPETLVVPKLPGLQAHFDRAPEPKRLILLEGTAHAQFMFQTDQAGRVMREIVQFLSAP
jgi:pimeloyl-ACP methyl ester carboxylesterase